MSRPPLQTRTTISGSTPISWTPGRRADQRGYTGKDHAADRQQFLLPSVLTFVTDIYDPVVKATKTVVDQNGALSHGDVLRYLVNVTNSGQDAAVNTVLTDAIPANTTYVPNSLEIVSGPTAAVRLISPDLTRPSPSRLLRRASSSNSATVRTPPRAARSRPTPARRQSASTWSSTPTSPMRR